MCLEERRKERLVKAKGVREKKETHYITQHFQIMMINACQLKQFDEIILSSL